MTEKSVRVPVPSNNSKDAKLDNKLQVFTDAPADIPYECEKQTHQQLTFQYIIVMPKSLSFLQPAWSLTLTFDNVCMLPLITIWQTETITCQITDGRSSPSKLLEWWFANKGKFLTLSLLSSSKQWVCSLSHAYDPEPSSTQICCKKKASCCTVPSCPSNFVSDSHKWCVKYHPAAGIGYHLILRPHKCARGQVTSLQGKTEQDPCGRPFTLLQRWSSTNKLASQDGKVAYWKEPQLMASLGISEVGKSKTCCWHGIAVDSSDDGLLSGVAPPSEKSPQHCQESNERSSETLEVRCRDLLGTLITLSPAPHEHHGNLSLVFHHFRQDLFRSVSVRNPATITSKPTTLSAVHGTSCPT